jgi:alkyl hydroperoxide reductase subunit AhpC
MITYPQTTGRNFHEVLRVLESLQLTAGYSEATPANWKHGEDVIVEGFLLKILMFIIGFTFNKLV